MIKQEIGIILSLSILLCISFLLHKSFFVLVIACYFIVSFFIIIRIKTHTTYEYSKYNLYTKSDIPNIIYTYWHSETLPLLVKKCISSWKRHLPNYSIHIIHDKNISEYISEYINDLYYTLL